MRRILAVAITLVTLSVSACGHDDDPQPAAPTSLPPVTSAAPALTADFASETACKFVAVATKSNTSEPLFEPGRVDGITAAAAQSKIPDIKEAGQILAEKYTLAVAQDGTDKEESANESLLAAAVRLDTACDNAGLSSD
jgi:hypothetical protein